MSLSIQKLTTLTTVPSLDAAGTAEQVVATSTLGFSAIIQALESNVGNVYIAGQEDEATSAKGHALAPGEVLRISPDKDDESKQHMIDLSDLWWDGDTAANKLIVSYMALKERNP